MGNQDKATYGTDERNGISQGSDQTADNPFKESEFKTGEITRKTEILRDYEETSYGRVMSQ